MKNVILTILLSALAFGLYGQHQLGIRGGYQATSLTIDGISAFTPDAEFMDNFVVGAFYHIPIRNGFGFQPEINLSQKGFVIKESFDVEIFDFDIPLGAEARTRIKYIEAPLLLKYTHQADLFQLYIEGGPVVGYAVDADVRTRINAIIDINVADTDINIDNDIYNRWEAGAIAGLGIGIPMGRTTLQAGFRYQHSISDLLNDPIIDVRGRNYGFTGNIGLAFQL